MKKTYDKPALAKAGALVKSTSMGDGLLSPVIKFPQPRE